MSHISAFSFLMLFPEDRHPFGGPEVSILLRGVGADAHGERVNFRLGPNLQKKKFNLWIYASYLYLL